MLSSMLEKSVVPPNKMQMRQGYELTQCCIDYISMGRDDAYQLCSQNIEGLRLASFTLANSNQ